MYASLTGLYLQTCKNLENGLSFQYIITIKFVFNSYLKPLSVYDMLNLRSQIDGLYDIILLNQLSFVRFRFFTSRPALFLQWLEARRSEMALLI